MPWKVGVFLFPNSFFQKNLRNFVWNKKFLLRSLLVTAKWSALQNDHFICANWGRPSLEAHVVLFTVFAFPKLHDAMLPVCLPARSLKILCLVDFDVNSLFLISTMRFLSLHWSLLIRIFLTASNLTATLWMIFARGL